jgi:hypothetical protein
MLHRLLQLCLVAIATILLAGEVSACPHHAGASQQVSDGASGAIIEPIAPTRQAAEVAVPAPPRAHLTDLAHAHNPHDGKRTASQHASELTDSHNRCCGVAGCGHFEACAGACCAAAPTLLGAGGQPQERKVAFHPFQRSVMAIIVPATRPLPADGDGDQRRWRDAEALRKTLHQPRLARVVRLTI